MALTQNASASIQGHTIMSAIDMKPEHMTQLYRMNNTGMEARGYLYSHVLGFSEATGATTFYHTEKGLSNAVLTVGAQDTDIDGVSGVIAAGVAVLYTLTGDAATYVYVRKNDVVEFIDGTQGLVTAVSGVTFTVTPDTAVTIPDVASGEAIIITTRAFGEGTEVGSPAFTRSSQFSGVTQIMKDKVSASGTSLTDMTWVKYGDKGYYSMNLIDAELRHLRHIEGMFLHGKYTNTFTDPSSSALGKAITSGGLLQAAASGTSATVPTTMASFDDLSEANMSNFVSKSTPIYGMLGFNVMQGINTAFQGSSTVLIDSPNFLTKTTDDSLYKKSEAYGAFNNFKYYNSQYTYMFDVNEAWSDSTSYGATGFGYKNNALFVPIYKVKDGMSGKRFGTMGTRYKSFNGVNRKFMVDDHNGFGSVNGKTINEYDSTSTVYLSDMGAQFMGKHQYIYCEA